MSEGRSVRKRRAASIPGARKRLCADKYPAAREPCCGTINARGGFSRQKHYKARPAHPAKQSLFPCPRGDKGQTGCWRQVCFTSGLRTFSSSMSSPEPTVHLVKSSGDLDRYAVSFMGTQNAVRQRLVLAALCRPATNGFAQKAHFHFLHFFYATGKI